MPAFINASAPAGTSKLTFVDIEGLVDEGEQYGALKRTFLARGKGRKPSMPTLVITNKLLLQLYVLKEENNKSWDQLETWFSLIKQGGSFTIQNQVEKVLGNYQHILSLSSPEIERLTSLSSKEVLILKDLIAERFICKPCTALEILHKKAEASLLHWKLSTSCEIIDKTLGGGIISGVLTEISGESASGKTQFCLQLCISIQLNKSNHGGAVYICTEDVFPSKRLQQLIQTHSTKSPGHNFGDKIFIEHVADFETMELCVKKKLPTLLKRGLVRLIVIDSVAALFRCHYDFTQTFERAKHLCQFASFLRSLAYQYNMPIVCINQVSANMNNTTDMDVIPALGLTWTNQITCRVMMSRPKFSMASLENVSSEVTFQPTYRKLKVVFAPHLPQNEIIVYIDQNGIHGANF